jgi:diaminopimelate epimerase
VLTNPGRAAQLTTSIFAGDMLLFSKWQGTGNDFVVVDDRLARFRPTAGQVRWLCDRHMGVGSDGLILLRSSPAADFEMDFLNPDGSRSFCGNGSRCAFAAWSALVGNTGPLRFTACDGEHLAEWAQGEVLVSMRPTGPVQQLAPEMQYLHTGSPHLVRWVADPEAVDLVAEGRKWRYSETYKEEGVNVNFVAWKGDHLVMRTYERGVEEETLSCGTGVTAAALCAMHLGFAGKTCIVATRGGRLTVRAETGTSGFERIHLQGSVRHVFSGQIALAELGA